MPDPFSTAASSFAVVGAVDVVFRASVACRRFLSDIKDAPEEIDRLRTCITENTELFDNLKKYSADLQDPTSPMSSPHADLRQALNQLESAAKALQRELNSVGVLAKKFSGKDKTWTKVKFVLDGKKINKCLEKLERTKSTLTLVLSLVEGRRSALGQSEVEDMVQQNFQKLETTMDTQMQELSTSRANQEKILAKQETVVRQSTQQLKTTSLVRKDIRKATRSNQKEHIATRRQIAQSHREVLDTMSSSFRGLHLALPKARTSHRKIQFFGYDRNDILTPLLLMRGLVHRATVNILSEGVGSVSAQHLHWIQGEFENLVSSATQEVAALCPGSTATSFDQWHYSPRGVGSSGGSLTGSAVVSMNMWEAENQLKQNSDGTRDAEHRKWVRQQYVTFESSSPVGRLRITVRVSDTTGAIHDFNEAQLSFTPSFGICSTAIGARFLHSMNNGLEPRLHAQLIAFRLVENGYAYTELFTNGTLEQIDTAIRNGIISPYEQFRSGYSVCVILVAAFYSRLDVLQYLEGQGVGISTLNGELAVVECFWLGATREYSSKERGRSKQFLPLLEYLDRSIPGYVPVFPLCYSLGFHDWSEREQITDEEAKLIGAWIQFRQRRGYDIDVPIKNGLTTLLQCLHSGGEGSLLFVRLLLQFGADVRKLFMECGPLHMAMFGDFDHLDHRSLEILEEKLCMLIKAGADIHLQTAKVHTPSILSLENKCFDEWCRALERNGRNIDDVMWAERVIWVKLGLWFLVDERRYGPRWRPSWRKLREVESDDESYTSHKPALRRRRRESIG